MRKTVRLYPERCHLCSFHTLSTHTLNVHTSSIQYTSYHYDTFSCLPLIHTTCVVMSRTLQNTGQIYTGRSHVHQTLTKCSYKHASTEFANEPICCYVITVLTGIALALILNLRKKRLVQLEYYVSETIIHTQA